MLRIQGKAVAPVLAKTMMPLSPSALQKPGEPRGGSNTNSGMRNQRANTHLYSLSPPAGKQPNLLKLS